MVRWAEQEARWRDRLASITAERDDLARRLDAYDRTLAVRLATRFWRLMRRWLPDGSRRRAVYTAARRALASVAREVGSPVAGECAGVPLTAPAAARPQLASPPDVFAELLVFEARVRQDGARQVVAVFSATALAASEGQRAMQLASAIASRGMPVVFVYWRSQQDEWQAQDRLADRIFQLPVDVVATRPDRLAGAFARLDRLALFEFPWPGFFEMVAAAHGAGWVTLYDALEDWEELHTAGEAIWYDPFFERHLVNTCDAVFAVSEELAERLRSLGAGAVEVVGSGFHPGLRLDGILESVAAGRQRIAEKRALAGVP